MACGVEYQNARISPYAVDLGRLIGGWTVQTLIIGSDPSVARLLSSSRCFKRIPGARYYDPRGEWQKITIVKQATRCAAVSVGL